MLSHFCRLLGVPRRLERNRLAHLGQFEHRGAEIDRRERVQRPRHSALVAELPAVDDHHRLAIGVLLVARHVELGHQRVDAVLARTDPRTAAVDPRPVRAMFGERATTDPVPGFQQRHRMSCLLQPQRSGEPGETRPHDTKVHVSHAGMVHPPQRRGGFWQIFTCSSEHHPTIRAMERSGIGSHVGRCRASYAASYTALSSS